MPLSPEAMALLGETTAYMTLVEAALETAIAAMVLPQEGADLGPVLTVLAGQQASGLIDIFRRLGVQVLPDQRAEVAELVAALKVANERRNQFVHTVWFYGAELTGGGVLSMGLRRRRSGSEAATMTIEEMRATRDTVRAAHAAVLAFIEGFGIDPDDDQL